MSLKAEDSNKQMFGTYWDADAPEWGRHLLPGFFTPELVAQFTKGAWKNYDILLRFGWSREDEFANLTEASRKIKNYQSLAAKAFHAQNHAEVQLNNRLARELRH